MEQLQNEEPDRSHNFSPVAMVEIVRNLIYFPTCYRSKEMNTSMTIYVVFDTHTHINEIV